MELEGLESYTDEKFLACLMELLSDSEPGNFIKFKGG